MNSTYKERYKAEISLDTMDTGEKAFMEELLTVNTLKIPSFFR
jgi:hypothetical protein